MKIRTCKDCGFVGTEDKFAQSSIYIINRCKPCNNDLRTYKYHSKKTADKVSYQRELSKDELAAFGTAKRATDFYRFISKR